MGAALYIVAKKKPQSVDMLMDGKALARAEEALTSICSDLGVKPLMEFFSQNPDELADMLGDDVPDMPPEQWFKASDGLAIVRALASHLEKNPQAIDSGGRVLEDLRQCERILVHLDRETITWHFALDV
jgi:hypothetical protein